MRTVVHLTFSDLLQVWQVHALEKLDGRPKKMQICTRTMACMCTWTAAVATQA